MSNEHVDNALTIDDLPDDLRRPILLLAFFGWNDAAEAASDAIKFLRNLDPSAPVASLDPDDFFVFTEHRPTVKWIDGDNARREVVWPATEFTILRRPQAEHDLVLGLGTEPDLRWQRYCRAVLQIAEMAGVEEVVTLGALLADVAHTRPTSVSGGSSNPERHKQFGFEGSRYEGPTGVVGSIGDACRIAEVPHMGFWASVPHYVTSRHNPGATKALLTEIDRVFDLQLDLQKLDGAQERYRAQIDSALEEKPDIRDYVRNLEAQADEEMKQESQSETPLDSDDIMEAVNRLLRGDESN
ncbi:MAG: PAC2 family protein [Chloroflexi bacterium]|nr:PAC2 family protein [Chloroflexota bacterium]